jgi:hypothetical protein
MLGMVQSRAAVPDRCRVWPVPKPANSSAAAGSAARLPRVLNMLLPA